MEADALTGSGETAAGNPAWMITLADLISLLLTFAVLLSAAYRTNPPVGAAGEPAPMSVAEGPSLIIERSAKNAASAASVPMAKAYPFSELDYLALVVRDILATAPAMTGASVQRREDRLIVSLPRPSLFEGDSVQLSERSRRTLASLAPLLNVAGTRLAVFTEAPASRQSPLQDARVVDGLSALGQISLTGSAPRSTEPAAEVELALARASAVASVLRRAGLDRPIDGWTLARNDGDGIGEKGERSGAAPAPGIELVVFASEGD
jgi:chemotaxis protein MotB